MKLGLRTDLSQAEREKATKASELYNALAEKHDAETALPRFVYALEKLGHRRHGFRAVRQLKEFSIEKPAQYNPTGSQLEQEFNFFQCLVEICVHLDAKHHSRLSAYSAKMFLDGTNPKKIKTPCALLTELVEKRVIKTEDQSNLVEGLEIVGADRCIEHIHRYRHLNNLSEITGI